MATAATEDNPNVADDDGTAVDDVPDDFFEDFEKNDFLDGLEVLDDLSPSMVRRRQRSMSDFSSESSNFGLVEKQSHVLNEIKKLERDIAERRRKLCRRSPMLRSPSRQRRRSLSRRRRIVRSRSRSRGRRMRSRSRNRRSRSRGRMVRVLNLQRGRRDMPREKTDVGRKSLSFLEELSQKFAEQGKAFPEAEAFDINAMNNYNSHPNNFMGPMPMYNPMMGSQPPQWLHFNNPSMMGSGPPGMPLGPPGLQMPDPLVMQQMMMHPVNEPHVAMDLESSNSNERMDTPPPPSIVKREFEEPNSKYCDTDEMIRKTFRETVLTRCRDVVNLLKSLETQLVKPPNLHYIPTVISYTVPFDMFLSPLQSVHNVEFSFDNQDKAPSYIKRLSPYAGELVHTLGFNIKTAKFPVHLPPVDETAELPDDAVPVDLKFDIGTQTEPLQCNRCHQNDLREFKDKTTQVAAVTYHIGCQTSNEDPYSFAKMTPAQVVAINDFGKILKNSLMPSNYREATDLRDRLFNIYQTCTGLNKNEFLRDNEHRINPSIFRDTTEPVRETRMTQNNMMHSDRFDNRQMNVDSRQMNMEPRQMNMESRQMNMESRQMNMEPRQRSMEPRQRSIEPRPRSMESHRFELSRLDRGDQIFSRQPDSFSSNNMTNMSTNTQDRFMQTQNIDRFDSMTQNEQFSPMRNSDPRNIQQRQNDFGGNRISEQHSISTNRFDMNQDRFTSLNTSPMNQQQQQSNIWGDGSGSGGASSSLSPLTNNSRSATNEDFARRTVPQPLFPETSSGVMTCKQIMEMERGLSNRNQILNNSQFENNNPTARNLGATGGGGAARGNRGNPSNRNPQQNRFPRGGNSNRF